MAGITLVTGQGDKKMVLYVDGQEVATGTAKGFQVVLWVRR